MASRYPVRVVETVSEHPKPRPNTRLHLHGYNATTIATMTSQHYNTVARHIKAGKLDLGSLDSVRNYLNARQSLPVEDPDGL